MFKCAISSLASLFQAVNRRCFAQLGKLFNFFQNMVC
jgi:hypothetical protein